jgi:hypothetical protein
MMSALPQEDYKPGDPATHVLGKPEEQPARKHRPLRAVRHISEKTILADIKLRRQTLEPLVEEYRLLKQADEALKGI